MGHRMRSFTLVGLMIGLNGSASFAIEPEVSASSRPLNSSPEGVFSTGSGRKPLAQQGKSSVTNRSPQRATNPTPGSKNYYKGLFAEEPVAVAKQASPSELTEAKPTKEVSPSQPSTTAAKSQAASDVPPTASVKPIPKRLGVAGVDIVPSDTLPGKPVSQDRVARAGFETAGGVPEKQTIRQVGSLNLRSRQSAPQASAVAQATERTPMPRTKVGAAIESPSKPASPTRSEGVAVIPQLSIEWVKKGDLNVGQESQVELHVKNCGLVVANEISVEAVFPTNIRLTSADPKPTATADKVIWSIDRIAPGAEQTILVKLIPSRRGDLGATAQVRFTGTSSVVFHAEEPLLKVALKGPSTAMLGDPASVFISVSNPGTGIAHDVKVEARLSEGLEHGRGDKLIMDVGSIGSRETRTVRLGLSAIKGGPQSINVTATSSSNAADEATSELNVIAPSLKIAMDGPALRYKGRNAKYTVTISNDGSVANDNILVTQNVPDGFQFVSADRDGKHDATTKTVQWFVGRLEPGKTIKVTCELNPLTLGEFSPSVVVLSDSGARAEAKVETKVDGVASLTMELVDIDDPVETGVETYYEIRVQNEGSKPAAGVSISCELPVGMELLNAKAPIDAVVEGRQIVFKGLDQVAPGARIVYKIHVKGIEEGSHRMKAKMVGGGLSEPVLCDEVTKVYSDSK